jgi:hypothetical protein
VVPFEELFAQHVATAMARQIALADLIGERGWSVDLSAGSATFGDDLRFPIQLLGSESHLDGTWLWAWANHQSGLPPALLHLCGWLRDYGGKMGIAELTEPSFPLDRADGAKLALVASGLTGRPYYRGPYEGGALFFHLEGVPDAPVAPERAITVLSQVIQTWPLPHRLVAGAFLTQQGWALDEAGPRMSARHPDGSTIEITFDDLGRIAQFGGHILPR